MATIISIANAVPEVRVTADEVMQRLSLGAAPRAIERYARMVAGSHIGSRYVALPVDELLEPRDQTRRSAEYAEAALRLCEETSSTALRIAGVRGSAIDAIVAVSCTGFLMPSVDAYLLDRIGMNPVARRLPITELGCSAGAAALGIASELLRAGAARTALVLSAELCSLCTGGADLSAADVLGRILFGDGAAAAVLSGAHAAGPKILASQSVLIPESTELLTTFISDQGFRLALSPAVPTLLRKNLRHAVDAFLVAQGLGLADLAFFAIHPGGPKILEAVEDCLELRPDALAPSWEILSQFGNMSSATIFFVLQHLQQTREPRRGDLGLAVAFGPGITCEFLLLRWGERFRSGGRALAA